MRRETITKNLNAALICLRLKIISAPEPALQTRFWIDAVCINQEDNDERVHQVPLMGKTYSMALYVALWVGVDRGNSSLALAFIEEAARNLRNEDRNSLPKWYI